MMILFFYHILFQIFIISFFISINWETNSSSNAYSTINIISIQVNDSSFTSAFFKAACNVIPAGEQNFTGFKWLIFKSIFLKISKGSAKNKVLLLGYNSRY